MFGRSSCDDLPKSLHARYVCWKLSRLYSMEDACIFEPSYASFQKDAFMFYQKLSCWLQNSTTNIYAGACTFEISLISF